MRHAPLIALAAAAIKGNAKVTGIGKHSIPRRPSIADVLEKWGEIAWGEDFYSGQRQAELHGIDMDMEPHFIMQP